MSQFDYPRINFFGKTSINVGTCNNDDFKPPFTQNGSGLMVNDIVKAQGFLPPRVYVTDKVKNAIQSANTKDPATMPAYDFVSVGDSGGVDYYYVAIEPINTAELFYAWAPIPLGQASNDTAFHPLYKATELTGDLPGEWNYNGGMQNVIHDCSVVSVAVKPTDNSGNNLFLASDPGTCPEDLHVFLGATFNAMNSGGANTAVVTDLNPSASYTTQYFTDTFSLLQEGSKDTLMAGKPVKGVTRWINFARVVNIPGSPMIASGAVFQAIPAEDLSNWNQLEAAFQNHGDTSKELIGAFIRYDMFEVYEDRNPDYSKLTEFGTNPAYMSVVGSITPWYEGEMATASSGRFMNPTSQTVSNYGGLAPITFKVDTTDRIASFDLFNTLPENRTPVNFDSYPNGNTPPAMSYELVNLGQLDFKVNGTTLGSLTVDGSNYSRQDFINNGGIWDWVYSSSIAEDTVSNYDFSLWGNNTKSDYVQLMGESQYTVQSDQSCAYTNAGGANNSFLSQGTTYTPMVLRVFDRGVPVPQTNAVQMTQTTFGLDVIFSLLQLDQDAVEVYDGMSITWDTTQENILLRTYSPAGITPPTPSTFSGATEFYVNLRVLPDQSEQYAGYYLQPGDPGYKKLDWNALFDEIFFTYYMLFPAMTQQLPLNNATAWEEPFTASRLVQVISQDMWDSPWYMPRNRSLSDADRKLIDTWAKTILQPQS